MIGTSVWMCPKCKKYISDTVHICGPFAVKPGPIEMIEPPSALGHQVGGDHYKALKIQPIEYIHANGIPFAEGCVIKYVTRWRAKNGVADLKKARHFLDQLIEHEDQARG